MSSEEERIFMEGVLKLIDRSFNESIGFLYFVYLLAKEYKEENNEKQNGSNGEETILSLLSMQSRLVEETKEEPAGSKW